MNASAAPVRSGALPKGSWAGIRASVALLLVLLYAGASTARWLYRGTTRQASSATDEISANDLKFQKLRPLVPTGGVVGYLGSPEPTGPDPRQANAAALLHFRRYLLAQYTLAPVVLVESTEPEFVVGNFDPGLMPAAPVGFRVMRDFGDGLVLYRRLGE